MARTNRLPRTEQVEREFTFVSRMPVCDADEHGHRIHESDQHDPSRLGREVPTLRLLQGGQS